MAAEGSGAADAGHPPASRGQRRGWLVVALASPVVLVVAVLGLVSLLGSRNLGTPTDQLTAAVPNAPRLVASGPDQVVYRIDAGRSSVSYDVDERLAGSSHTAHGTTRGVAGDLLVDTQDPTRSRLGDVVVNVEQLTSDQELRDRRIRADHLESARHPLATFHTERLSGLPATIADGTSYPVRAEGTLTVRDVTRPATVEAQVTRQDGTLQVVGTSAVKLSDFGIGPISMAGFVTVGDDARLTFDLVAVPESQGVPSRVPSVDLATGTAPTTRAAGAASSYAKTVQPILEEHCASCHAGGAVGTHVLALDTARDAAAVAPGLALAVSSRYMPPWPASDLGVPFEHQRSLSRDEVDAIVAWSGAGAPLDLDGSTPIVAAPGAEGTTIRHDIAMPLPEPYQPTPATRDDYRCFLLDPHVTEPTWVTGFEFTPDQTAVVHHATVSKTTGPGRAAVDRLDRGSEGPGWSCAIGAPLTIDTGGAGADAATPAPGPPPRTEAISTWAPGQTATGFPSGAGIRLDPGDFFTIQIHYHVEHPTPPDRSTFAVQTDAGPLDVVRSDTYLGPAEIPCPAGTTTPACERQNELASISRTFGVGAALIPDGLLMMCGQKAEDFAGMVDGRASSSCTHAVTNPGTIVWVMGHEHQIGSSIRLTINAGRPDERILLDIPRWQFDWQLIYRPAEPVTLHADDTVTIDCSWDRELRADPEPRYITWSEGSGDEMCHSVIATRSTSP